MRFVILLGALLAGCETMAPSGDVLAAVDAAPLETPQQDPPPAEPEDEPLVPGEAPPEASAEDEELLVQPLDLPLTEEVVPSDEALVDATEAVPVEESSADIQKPRWGLRVLSTLSDTTPPRAVVVLPDGTEEVVRPGSMLPQAGVVVLSIAKDVVEISEIEAQGMYASIRTRSVQALVAE